jgi:agmatine deiminase
MLKFDRNKYNAENMVHNLRLSLLVLLLPSSGLFAQSDIQLPRYATQEEIEYYAQRPPAPATLSGFTTPPGVPVRAMAEWEELEALAISWNATSNARRNILTEIVRAAREECRVIISCGTQTILDGAKTYLTDNDVDISSNVEFLLAPSNSIWIRDYGPNAVYANDVDSLYLVDWIYNRQRPFDDVIPVRLGEHLDVPVYSTTAAPFDLVNTGGNFMSDGLSTGFSSKLVFRNNDQSKNGECGNTNDIYGTTNHSESSIDGVMEQFLGIKRYIKFDELAYDCIHHIDMHIKLLDEETILLGKYPDNVADGPQIEANLAYLLDNHLSAFGTPYKVIRIDMPPDFGNVYPDNGGSYRTYVNAVFVNKTVLLPVYEEKYDTTALRVWQEALPGYNVVGINSNDLITLDGAIHCITKEIGVSDPLRIVHQPLRDVVQTDSEPQNYPVHALLQHRKGIDGGRVWYTTDTTAAWQFVDMAPYSPGDTANIWAGYIPRQNGGQYVYYYIEAKADGGQRTRVRPMPAPKGWWKFYVEPEIVSTYTPLSTQLQPVFPNPAAAVTCVPVHSDRTVSGTITVYNTLGQAVHQIFDGKIPAGPSRYYFDAARFQSGAYFIELRSGGRISAQRIIIR